MASVCLVLLPSRLESRRGAGPHMSSRARKVAAALATGADLSGLDEQNWDALLRLARSAGVLGRLAARIARADRMTSIPPDARDQLVSERALGVYRKQMLLWELERVGRALSPSAMPIVLLKGAAYVVQGLPFEEGRMPADIDILVPGPRLHEAETVLLRAGWEAQSLEPYDEHYYRSWSHEIPPLRYPGSGLELDVHHNLLPPLGRVRPMLDRLFQDSLPTHSAPFRVLSPEDQVVHAVLHVFYDSDCGNRLRDIVDIDGLLRHFAQDAGFWPRLTERAYLHGAARVLWYGLRYASLLLDTPVPQSVHRDLRMAAPNRLVTSLMDALIGHTLAPPDPDEGTGRGERLASSLLLVRSQWLRFPLQLFFAHAGMRMVRTTMALVRRPAVIADR